ncbi:hypothetical protein ACQP3C_29025, partial [Escherichia coli]
TSICIGLNWTAFSPWPLLRLREAEATHLSTHIGVFVFKDQDQVIFISFCKEFIDLHQPAIR